MPKQTITKNDMKNITAKLNLTLKGWQDDVIDEIIDHEGKRDSELCQGLSEYVLNRQLGITIAMPKGSGHTTFANYIAALYPTALIYGKMDHYRKVTGSFTLNAETETISLYEIFHALYKNPQHPSPEIHDIRSKLKSKQVIVVDNASTVSDDIKNFVYDSAGGIVIMLG